MAKREPKNVNEHSDALTSEINRLNRHKKRLEKILEETKKSLWDVTHLKIFPLEDELFETIEILSNKTRNLSTIVILGTAKARAVNFILGENILPCLEKSKTSCNNWRGIRIRYGSKRQYKFSLDAETEVIESNNMDSNWDQIPNKKLDRNDSLDFSTIMDIELCNQFLKSGVQILVPPDLEDPTFENNASVVNNYHQWSLILQEIFPIIIYSLNENEYIKFSTINSIPKLQNLKIKNLSNNTSVLTKNKQKLKSPINGHSNSNSKFYIDCESESDSKESRNVGKEESASNSRATSNSHEEYLFNEENLLYLSQICEYHPNTSTLFLLFPDKIENFIDLSEIPSCSSNIVDTPNYSSESQSSSASEQYETEFSDTSNDDQDVDFISEKQKIFLDTLIDQLHSLVNILHVENSFLGHGLIVDDENVTKPSATISQENLHKTYKVGAVVQRIHFIEFFVRFSKRSFQNFMLNDCNKLSEIHNTLLQQFILSSYDMARKMQVIPTRIKYVAETEQELYNTLNKNFSEGEKREELISIMQKVLQDMKNSFSSPDCSQSSSSNHNSSECFNLTLASSIFYTAPFYTNSVNSRKSDSKNGDRIKEFELENSLDLNDYYVVTRSRSSTARSSPTPEPNENVDNETAEAEIWFNNNSSKVCSISNILDFRDDIFNSFSKSQFSASMSSRSSISSFKEVSLDVQRAVLAKLSRNISIHLVKFVDCLKDSYFGTLQRCLDSLEEGRCRRSASEAVKQILLVTNTVDLQYCASFSFLHALIDQLRRFFHRLSLFPNTNKSCCSRSPEWRRQVALNTIESLSALKLAKLISSQLKEKIRISHEKFQKALESLSEHHAVRLSQTEEVKLAVRKLYAPRFARLCLESTSLRDYIKNGLPRLGKEIGRGQYGVVFSLKGSWGGHESCAVKSVLPPDERHFNELAMEFYHTRSIPLHDRIVKLLGSVIDYSHLDGSPSVLLISECLKWDLHCALSVAKMSLYERMQITVDIVEGIRYLHSQGLVHRDIKLKNVLLDDNNRAKLTDLGFCIPEAMISGSIVGTPIHMAPELLGGVYDNSVDVYAFGILFWYLCAGSVKLPAVYENFHNKEQLWTSVKRGLRPEKLPQFSDIAWELMKTCWASEPSQRPLLGDVQPIVEEIRDNSHPDMHDPSNPLSLFDM